MKFLQTLGLKSKNPDTRRETVENLGRESDMDILKYLYPMLQDPDATVRREAVKSIASFREGETVPYLQKCFADTDREVRTLAAGSLTKILVPEAVQALIAGLRDKDFAVRKKASAALEIRGWRPSTPEESIVNAVANGRFMEAAAEGEVAIDLLAEVFQSDTASTRQEALRALSTIDSPRTFRYIAIALKDPESFVRAAAVEALQQVRDVRIFDPLVDATKDSDERVRHIATEALGNLGGVRAVTPLIGLLRDPGMTVRVSAADALGKLGDARAIEPLLGCVQDSERDMRVSVVQALGKLGDARAIGPLVAMLKDAEGEVRSCAKSSLNSIDRNWQHSEHAREALPELQTAMYDREYWVRQAAAKTLAELNEAPQIVPEIPSLQMSLGKGQNLEEFIVAGLEPILAELEVADPATRYRAAIELGKIQNPRAIPSLFRRLFDEEDGVRKAAAEVLETLNWQPADEGQRAWHCVILRRWDDAVNLGPAAVDALMKALETFDPSSQKAAAEALGKLRDWRAVEPLLKALVSTDFGIRKAAALALGDIGDPGALMGLMEAQNDKFKIVRDAAEQAIAKLGVT